MRFGTLAACIIAFASSILAAPLPSDPPRGGACIAPSQPDHKVDAYPATHMAPVKAIAPSKEPELLKMPQREHREPAFALPELHRKITVHENFAPIDAQSP
jgi:hypothetical protein